MIILTTKLYIHEKNAHMRRQLQNNVKTLNQDLWLQEIAQHKFYRHSNNDPRVLQEILNNGV